MRRPNSIEEISFAQFARMYKGISMERSAGDEDGLEDNDCLEHESEVEEDESVKFNYVMTYRELRERELPLQIVLKDTSLGEATCMVRRSFPAALRYHKSKKDKDPKRFMLMEIMLYYPLRDEVAEADIESIYEEKCEGIRKVDLVKRQVMEFLEDVEEARYYVDQLQKEQEIDLMKVTGLKLDAAGEIDNEECVEEDIEEDEEFEFCHPDNLDELHSDEASASDKLSYRKIELLDKKELISKTRNLDDNQMEVLSIVLKYSKDIVKSRDNGDSPPTPPLLMVHGGAGAGKSTVINVIEQWAQRILQKEGNELNQLCVIKTAFTGCAASNIRGQTLHAAFGFSFGDKHFSLSGKIIDKRRAELKNLKVVIIDEISMVKVDMLYMIDLRLQV